MNVRTKGFCSISVDRDLVTRSSIEILCLWLIGEI